MVCCLPDCRRLADTILAGYALCSVHSPEFRKVFQAITYGASRPVDQAIWDWVHTEGFESIPNKG